MNTTLTLFIDHLYTENLGTCEFQVIADRSFLACEYRDLTISGALYKDLVFEEVIFENCIFLATTIENCLFINCLFINCKFQFSRFSDCNFELTGWENCIWGYLYESDRPTFPATTQINEFINLCA
jgi:uncharacterized protein YjbI with pentapeptide repeats